MSHVGGASAGGGAMSRDVDSARPEVSHVGGAMSCDMDGTQQ